jgi:glycerophosphoryl diester phosphodiesterase
MTQSSMKHSETSTSSTTNTRQRPWRKPWYTYLLRGLKGASSRRLIAECKERVQATTMPHSRFLLHIGDGPEAAYQVDLWYPYIAAVDPHAIVVVRLKELFEHLCINQPTVTALYIESGIDAEWLILNCPHLAGILYTANTGNSVAFLRHNHLRHVFLGHGDSEKAASCYKFFRAYDELWAAGRAHIQRFRHAGFRHDSLQFRIVGRPTLRPLMRTALCGSSSRFLYLPTWEGIHAEQEYTSLYFGAELLATALRHTSLNAVVKLHPWTGKRLKELKSVFHNITDADQRNRIKVIDPNTMASDLMLDSSFLVADISSVVSDYLACGRPIFLYTPKDRPIRTTRSGIAFQDYCYCYDSISAFASLLQRVVADGDDWLRQSRLDIATYFVDKRRTLDSYFELALTDVACTQGKALPSNVSYRLATEPLKDSRVSTGRIQSRTACPLVLSHRGAGGGYPENSLAGFRWATTVTHLHAVELDVQLTADNEVVVIHDVTLDRTTSGRGFVRNATIAELKCLKLRSLPADGPPFADETIPDLQEALTCIAPSHLAVHIELKHDHNGHTSDLLVEKVLRAIAESDLRSRVTLTSFSTEVLASVRWRDPDIPLVASVDARSFASVGGLDRFVESIRLIPGCSVALHRSLLASYPHAKEWHHFNGSFGVWPVNDENTALKCSALGAKFITTDHPTFIIDTFHRQT